MEPQALHSRVQHTQCAKMSFGHFLQQTAQIAKFAFDHVLIDNRNGPAADSFDFMRLNAVNRRVFMNVRSEFMSSPSAEARRLLHRSNLAEIVSTAPMILDAMKRLVKALGLRNWIDDDQLITQQYMDRNYDTIMVRVQSHADMSFAKTCTLTCLSLCCTCACLQAAVPQWAIVSVCDSYDVIIVVHDVYIAKTQCVDVSGGLPSQPYRLLQRRNETKSLRNLLRPGLEPQC